MYPYSTTIHEGVAMPVFTIPSQTPRSRAIIGTDGELEVVLDGTADEQFLPQVLRLINNTAEVIFKGDATHIKLTTEAGALTLTPNGYSIGAGAVAPYSAAAYGTLAEKLRTDRSLQSSTLQLRKVAAENLYGLTAAQGIVPSRAFAHRLVEASKRQALSTTAPTRVDCTTRAAARALETALSGWLDEVQVGTPETLTAKTWDVAETIADEVVRQRTYCSGASERFPGPWGGFALPTDVLEGDPPAQGMASAPQGLAQIQSSKPPAARLLQLLGSFGAVIKCMVQNGAWKVITLQDAGVTIPGVKVVPVALEVRLNRACTDALKKALTGADVLRAIPSMVTAFQLGGVSGVMAALGIGAAASTVIGAGVTIGQVLLVAALVLAAHALIVAGQLVTYDTFGMASRGVRLAYPAMPAVALGVLNPVAGLVALANTPVIVIPRS
jgi:hypothetical protein